jgi:prepilin-type processing-associated H-X9-DG protein
VNLVTEPTQHRFTTIHGQVFIAVLGCDPTVSLQSDPRAIRRSLEKRKLVPSQIDGYMQVDHGRTNFPDVPGSYHKWGCGFSFADGHAEMRKWATSVLKIHVKYGYRANSIPTGFTNPDWKWYTEHAACPQPAP